MCAAPTAAPGDLANPDPATVPGSRAGRLLALVRKLIDYGRELAAALQRDPANRPRHFGTGDIALILARITRGLHRARALEERLVRNAGRLDAPPGARRSPLSSSRERANRPSASGGSHGDPGLADLPTPEQIAAEVRRRPIGAVLADICRDLHILPNHPLWPEIRDLIRRHGGNLAKLVEEISAHAGRRIAEAWAANTRPAPFSPCPARAGTGPPDPLA